MELENTYENTEELVEWRCRRAGGNIESLKPECQERPPEPVRRNLSPRLIYTLLCFSILLSVAAIVTAVIFIAGNHEKNVSALAKLQDEISQLIMNFSSCPKQWTRFRQSCYQISSGTANWKDAQSSCLSMNAHLFVSNNVAEQEYIKTNLRNTSWIGLSDLVQEGNWRWVDGTDFSSSEKFWKAGEPNNEGHENCVEMFPDGKWNDKNCDALKNWICEKPVWF
ncbi:CD209 antigen-like protein C [Hypanus sabinus]|uniref:CD209 antigen-like protein C n=1 Tax=Hypanus sabinus TaxID=79690 RepID=UPI0028C390A6|nr:CD209 antigen-like protein C [Hypanus sabinus]